MAISPFQELLLLLNFLSPRTMSLARFCAAVRLPFCNSAIFAIPHDIGVSKLIGTPGNPIFRIAFNGVYGFGLAVIAGDDACMVLPAAGKKITSPAFGVYPEERLL